MVHVTAFWVGAVKLNYTCGMETKIHLCRELHEAPNTSQNIAVNEPSSTTSFQSTEFSLQISTSISSLHFKLNASFPLVQDGCFQVSMYRWVSMPLSPLPMCQLTILPWCWQHTRDPGLEEQPTLSAPPGSQPEMVNTHHPVPGTFSSTSWRTHRRSSRPHPREHGNHKTDQSQLPIHISISVSRDTPSQSLPLRSPTPSQSPPSPLTYAISIPLAAMLQQTNSPSPAYLRHLNPLARTLQRTDSPSPLIYT
jgi:hypothetical protein